MDPIQFTSYQYLTKQNRFLPITVDEQQGLNKHHKSRVIIAAIKTLIIRAIIAQNNKIINGRLPWLSTRVYDTYFWLIRCDHVRADRRRRLLNVQGKMCVGRRKTRHFCITTTGQIIGAAAAAPAAPLSTPLCLLKKKETKNNTGNSLLVYDKTLYWYFQGNHKNAPKIACDSHNPSRVFMWGEKAKFQCKKIHPGYRRSRLGSADGKMASTQLVA